MFKSNEKQTQWERVAYIVGMLALLAVAGLQFCVPTLLGVHIAREGSNTPLNVVRIREAAGSSDRIKVFYNVYASSADDAFQRAKNIVKEQMAMLLPQHEVYVRSIGKKFKVKNATHIQHDEEGSEFGTLKLLWDHCQHSSEIDNPSSDEKVVVYLHNKGSFHPKMQNDLLRKWLTRAALSKECSNMPSSCNVCSWRFSPIPHPHTSGNMWAARCEYIRKLINPMKFQLTMAQLYNTTGENPQRGTGRYAAEHWVHSHPSIQACDLSTSGFVFGYDGIPLKDEDDEFILEAAPRYDWNTFFQLLGKSKKPAKLLDSGVIDSWMMKVGAFRRAEYESLYNETAPASWFGWKFYSNSSDPTALDTAKAKG